MPGTTYATVIERGYTPANDAIIDFLKPRIRAPYIDIGCNTGWLLSEVPGGIGVDNSMVMVAAARAKGLDVMFAAAEMLPYFRVRFETAVLSCILEQCYEPARVMAEARRIAKRVIGVNPIPGSAWGVRSGYVRSVIDPAWIESLGGVVEIMDRQRYYFEIGGTE